ncbi:hypothetical protein CK203_033626 [Vitis vinifera]|uniref:SAWADEE domain-containing protein n=1 Tax=Vitis vinifera TaxID=29760 RepID=A0A438HSC5_VITVI|nr:hypothetical protein CK203_033626 [Vitis vinifera]
MGTGTGDATVELEAMRKDDSSWHPCRVSLSSTGFGLIVDFGSQDLEDIISNEEEALARLRIRSVPLQGEDCSLIEEGERVLATHKSHFKTLSFDAMVEKEMSHEFHIECDLIDWGIMLGINSTLPGHTCSATLIPFSAFGHVWNPQNQPNSKQGLTVDENLWKSKELLMVQGYKLDMISIAECAVGSDCVVLSHWRCREALRVRHSTRISCRCTFVIKWLHQDLKGATSIVPSSSIMKLATQSITVHPMVAAFLKPIKTLNCSAAPSFSTVFEDVDCEVDLHKLLEKQIEEISNLADASKKEISEDILFGIKGESLQEIYSFFKQITSEHGSQGSTTPDSSIQKELSENRAYLSPLASRAALASIMSNLPQKLEFSIYHEEENGFACAPDNITNKHVTMDLLNGTKPVKDKLSSEIEAAFIPAEIFKSLITTEKGASRRPLLVEASSEIANPKSQNDASPSLSGLIEERELRQPAKESRFTSSAIQKHAVSSTSNAEMKTHAEEIKSVALTNKRLTRSAVHKQEENLAMEVKQRSEVNNSAQDIESNSSEGNVTIPDRKAPKKKKPVSLPPAAQSSPVTEERNKKRKMPSAVETASKTEGKVSRNGGNSESQKSKSTSSKKQELRFSPRLRFLPRTRSANKC